MQIFFEQSDRSSHEYPDQYFYLRLPWKDYRLCTKQFLPQNYHRAFPQFREMGRYLTWKYFKILRSWNYLFRSTAHRKACFLYCGWYHSFKTIGALKTNRLLYPSGMKKKLSELAAELSVTEKGFDPVTVKNRKYYVCRWTIGVFFRQCKTRLALDTYQIRSSKGIQRYWLLMSMAHYICVISTGQYQSFQEGYQLIRSTIQQEKYQYLFQCAKSCVDFEAFMKLAG